MDDLEEDDIELCHNILEKFAERHRGASVNGCRIAGVQSQNCVNTMDAVLRRRRRNISKLGGGRGFKIISFTSGNN